MIGRDREQKNMVFIGACCLVALFVITAVLLLYTSDAFKPEPKMTVFPDNTYDETLHVVTDIDYEPYSYVDENGDYIGLDVELSAEIANRIHMNLDLELMDWPDANERFFTGEADAILNMETDLIAQDDRMIGSIPTAEKQYVVYGRETVSSVAELYGRRVASLHALPELDLEDGITYIDSYAEIFEGLKAGEYEFAICPIQAGNVFLQRLDMADVHPSYAVSHVYGAIALAADREDLKARIDEAISEMTKEGRLEELDRKWISNRYQSMTLKSMLFSHPWIIIVFFVGLAFIVFLLFNLNALSRSSRAKTVFLSNMSHDIRTPMNAIIGYTNLASGEDITLPEMREYLKKIRGSSQHLLALINDVLEMSRIESGRMDLEEAPTDLKQVMDGVQDMFATQMKEKDITFTVDDSGIKNRMVICDENRLNRILLNLISNAYKFTPEGGKVMVMLSQTDDGTKDRGHYRLSVKDTGIGMSKEFAAKVFEAFERERTSTVSGIQGTGLGMAITKSIVDLMGGDIKVKTAPGEGTEFTVGLSFAFSGEEPKEEVKETAGEEAAVEPDFSKMRVLLVEDMDINREIATMLLTNFGFTVETATNGQKAVDAVKDIEPGYFQLVLMDIQMPVMNGYEAARTIRALPNPAASKLPIIAMTANAFAEDIQRAKEAGMDGHIAKPIEVENMIGTIKEVLQNRGEDA